MEIVVFLLILIPFVLSLIISYVQGKFATIIKLIPMILIYIMIVVLTYFSIMEIPYIKNLLQNSVYELFDRNLILLVSFTVASIICCPVAIFLDDFLEKYRIKKIENSFKIEEISYYRELLDDISPAMLSMIYNPKANIEDQITATKLYLEKYKKDNLKEHEKYLLEVLKDENKYDMKLIHKNFKNRIIDDLIDADLIYDRNINNSSFTNIGYMQIVTLCLFIFHLIMIPAIAQISSLILMIVLSYFSNFISFPIYDLAIKNANTVIRKEKGMNLKIKLDGLKKYLIDFTSINEKSIEDINLFDEYILYAIIFDLDGKLEIENQELYNKLKKDKSKKIYFYVPKQERKKFILCLAGIILMFGLMIFIVIKDHVFQALPLLIINLLLFSMILVLNYVTKE